MPSRRALLAGTGGLVGLAGLTATPLVRLGDIEVETPGPDTWPLRQFDSANTAANVNADLPTAPSVAWTANPLPTGYPLELVVDRERVYAATGGQIVALDREAGRERWTDDGGRPLALHRDALYVAPGDVAPRDGETTLRKLDTVTGEPRWTTPTRSEGTTVLATDDVVLFGGERAHDAFDPSSGRRRWSAPTFTEAVPLVHDGALYAADGQFDGAVGRYRPRRLSAVPTEASPQLAWRTDHAGVTRGLLAGDDAVVAGFHADTDTREPGWECLDAADGTTRWVAIEMPAAKAVDSLAVAAGRCVANVGETVVARRLTDGHVDWRVSVASDVRDVAIVGRTVLVATAAETVRAVDLASGTEQWHVDPGVTPDTIAPVDGALFVGSPGGQVVALR